MKKAILLAISLFINCNASASLVSHGIGSLLTVRDCPTATNQLECIDESLFGPGTTQRYQQNSQTESSMIYTNAYSQGILTLDTDNLSLPEFSFEVTSDAQQRNGVNLYAYQQFLWTGSDATLTFNAVFDFIPSNREWGYIDKTRYPQSRNIDSSVLLTFSIYEEIFDELDGNFFPSQNGLVDWARFDSRNVTMIEDTKYETNLSIEVDVTFGQTFYLDTRLQAFGLNGGYIDALNTLTSSASAVRQSDGVVLEGTALQSLLVAQDSSVSVPEPNLLSLMVVSVLGLFTRKQFKKARRF